MAQVVRREKRVSKKLIKGDTVQFDEATKPMFDGKYFCRGTVGQRLFRRGPSGPRHQGRVPEAPLQARPRACLTTEHLLTGIGLPKAQTHAVTIEVKDSDAASHSLGAVADHGSSVGRASDPHGFGWSTENKYGEGSPVPSIFRTSCKCSSLRWIPARSVFW